MTLIGRWRRLVASSGSLLRHGRADAAILAVVALVVGGVAGGLSLLPRSLDRLADASLGQALDDAVVSRRSIRVEELVPTPTDASELPALRAAGSEALEGAGPALLDALEPPQLVLDLPRYEVVPAGTGEPAGNPVRLTLRVQDGLDGEVEVAEGRLAGPDVRSVPAAEVGARGRGSLTVHDLVVSTETAEVLGLAVGDRLVASPDPEDAVARRTATVTADPVVLELVGTVTLSDPARDVWFDDARLHRPAARPTGLSTTFFAFGLVTPDGLPGVPRPDQGSTSLADWRLAVRDGAIDAGAAPAVREQVRRLEAATSTTAIAGRPAVRTDLGALLDGEVARRAVAADTLALAGAATGAIAATLVALAAGLTVTRRRSRTALVRSRGGSAPQLVAAQALEATLLLAPAGAVGWAVAAAALPAPAATRTSVVVASLATLVAVLILVAAQHTEVRRPLADVFLTDRPAASPARRTLELLALVLAAVGAVVLRRRGVVTGAGGDLLVAAVPAVVAVAAGLAAARAYRWPLLVAARTAARRPGLAAATGTARSARDPLLAPAVAATVLALAIAVLAGAVVATVRDAQEQAAWRQVGAELRAESSTGALPAGALDALPDGTPSVQAHRGRATSFADDQPRAVELLIAPFDDLRAATAGSPLTFDQTTAATAADHLPVVTGPRGTAGDPVTIGDTFPLLLGPRTVTAEVVATVDAPPVIGTPGLPWVVAPPEAVTAVAGVDLVPNLLAAAVAPDEVAVTARRLSDLGGLTVSTRVAALDELRAAPLTHGVLLGYTAVTVVALLAALAALVVVLTTTAAARGRDLSLLAAVGADRRQLAATGLVDVLPPVLGAVATGTAAGVALTALVRGALDLGPFVGGAAGRVAPATPVALTAAIALVVALAASLAAVVAVVAAGRTSPVRTLRAGAAP